MHFTMHTVEADVQTQKNCVNIDSAKRKHNSAATIPIGFTMSSFLGAAPEINCGGLGIMPLTRGCFASNFFSEVTHSQIDRADEIRPNYVDDWQ